MKRALSLLSLVACTTIDDPRDRASVAPQIVLDGGEVAASDAAASIPPPCSRSHDWRVRGFPASFFAGQGPGVGAWGIGDAFHAPDRDEQVRLDTYIVGTADELRDRKVPLGQGHNASLETFTHWIVLRLGCNEDGSVCAPGTYLPVSGDAVVTRIEPRNGSSFEMHADDVVLRRGRQLKNGAIEFTDGPDACVFFHRLVVGGVMVAPSSTCAEQSYPECPLVENAHLRHP